MCVQLTSFETGRLIIASDSESTTRTANGEQGYRAVGSGYQCIMDNSRTSGVRLLFGIMPPITGLSDGAISVIRTRGPSTGRKDGG